MLFNSLAFLVFLPCVWACYYGVRSVSARVYVLLFASYLFYMWWRIDYVVLLLLSTMVDYGAGLFLGRTLGGTTRRIVLGLSILVNVGLLVVFKYWNFLAGELDCLGRLFDPGFETPLLDVLLPLGISFYTFQTMSYTIDVFRGKIAPERNLARFALYVSFFPQLVAGPIERAGRLLPQFRTLRSADSEGFVSGLRLMLWGMFKKVAVADRLAVYVDIVYGDPTSFGGAHFLVATVFFAMQIYCDFSGYSDIAIGCARSMGFDLMKNFSRPYLAWSPTEFWRRWHISLSNWFRDYVYIPLGGSRRGPIRNGVSLLATFLICGLWHGASWTFVAWGALHGSFVLVERMVRRLFRCEQRSGSMTIPARIVGTGLTLLCVSFAWVLFRADSMADAQYIFAHMFSNLAFQDISCGLDRGYLQTSIVLALFVVAYDIAEEWKIGAGIAELWDVLPRPIRWCGYWSVASCTILLGQLSGARQFIYFQF